MDEPQSREAYMLKTAGFAFAVCAIGTLAIAWSQHTRTPQQPIQAVETVNPDTLPHGPLSELKFNDMSFVFTDAN
jgi:hypothetical protein